MGTRITPVLVALLSCTPLASRPASAQWVDGGLPVCTTAVGKFGVMVAPDEVGGALLAWTAISSAHPEETDIFAQHVRADGSLDPGWPVEGVPVCTAFRSQYTGSIMGDGSGGAFIAWYDNRNPAPAGPPYSVYVQRITQKGAVAAGWPQDGIPVCSGGCTEYAPRLASDGAGGIFVAWQRDTVIAGSSPSPGGFSATRVLYSGEFARGWYAGGTEIASSSTRQRLNSILQDGEGGFYSVNDYDLLTHTYCHRVTTYGYPAIGWPADGLVISSAPSFGATAALDGQGGLFFFWSSFSASGDPSAGIYALRLTPEGSPAPGWPAEGLRVSSIESNEPLVSVATSDGGAIVSWFHFDSGVISSHAQKVSPTGSAPGWPENGVLLAQGDRYIQNMAAASDGLGGTYLAWEFYESALPGVPPPTGIVAQHLTSDGSPAQGWPTTGLAISASAFQGNDPAIIPVTGNAAVVAWEGYFNGPANRIMAQKLIVNGLESFSIVLTGSDVAPNEVRLQWRATPSADVPVRVYRRDEGGDWHLLDVTQPDMMGTLAFNDLTAKAGNSYSYRLSVSTGAEEHFYGETRVQVPAFALALRLASPNPVRGDLSVDLDLPSSGTARIELVDVRGRLVATKEVRVSNSTTLRLPIASGRGLASGVYFVRLTMAGKTVTRRAVMLH